MKDKSAFQQKIKLLTKLFDFGCNTEKKLQQLDMESILKIPGITIPDMIESALVYLDFDDLTSITDEQLERVLESKTPREAAQVDGLPDLATRLL